MSGLAGRGAGVLHSGHLHLSSAHRCRPCPHTLRSPRMQPQRPLSHLQEAGLGEHPLGGGVGQVVVGGRLGALLHKLGQVALQGLREADGCVVSS